MCFSYDVDVLSRQVSEAVQTALGVFGFHFLQFLQSILYMLLFMLIFWPVLWHPESHKCYEYLRCEFYSCQSDAL